MPDAVPPLASRLRPAVWIGLAVGLLRYAAEFVAPDQSMWFGVYYVMPAVYLWIGVTRRWGAVPWRTMAGTMVVLALIVWGIPNALAYTTGQFLEWNHGRFYFGGEGAAGNRAAPIADAALAKVGWGLLQGLLTGLAGTVWSIVWGTLVIWLPVRLRAPVAPA